ncbi:hypothetical protein RRSWK_04513 [Rhodopirellula sp. SWK7]|nr:hypothetical protein RRSWK_04513 [Rhodopirellula sp. SWK7]
MLESSAPKIQQGDNRHAVIPRRRHRIETTRPRQIMNPCWQLLICLCVLMSWPGNQSTLADAPLAGSPLTGVPSNKTQYVLLNNDRVLSGTVWMRGSSVIVRRGHEAELTLRANQVLAVEDDLIRLYQARVRSQRRRTLPSINVLISDLRWCIDQGIPDQATQLLMQIYSASPNHPVALQLESRLRRLAELDSSDEDSSAAVMNLDAESSSVHEIQPASHSVERPALDSMHHRTELPINPTTAPASLHRFTARVQPILISRCARCHHDSAPVATNWNLVLPPSGALRVTQRGSIANLEATLPHCDPNRPSASALITMAMQCHGEEVETGTLSRAKQQPPIAEHETALVRTLVEWIDSLSAQTVRDSLQSQLASSDDETEMLNDGEMTRERRLSPIQPSEVAASLSSPPALDGSPPASGRSPIEDPSTWSPIRESQASAAYDEQTRNSARPVRLPVVENPDNVRHFNRETRLLRQLGLGRE